ncbi:MAG: DUF1810 domain-containing protein [Gammaproteobacteria bacterium]|jgi:uncharacterized protein (DUF1810 family)|nr:DUF1810 domain-containing protein [Gammaproteobacteria bacterium]MDH3820314.1 DUF1810 domain-containing protein [Gammaproteobacteria bacterium]MDH4005469.1 DUF1810 domain-containing protein [Gammaproteobacteria bacterium]
MDDPFNLQRFVEAQAAVYPQVLDELMHGEKTSHWMWFIFPQIAGLGRSATAQQYAISSAGEAQAYLNHPVLGPRLVECVNFLLGIEGRTADQVFGDIDALKLRSSLTLFLAASGGEQVFEDALDKYFDGVPDLRTLTAIRC